jgi:hypothetical protein
VAGEYAVAPDALNEPLVVLQEDLRACKTVLEEFGMCGKLKRFVFGSKIAITPP